MIWRRHLPGLRVALYLVACLMAFQLGLQWWQLQRPPAVPLNTQLVRRNSARAEAMLASQDRYSIVLGTSSGVDGFDIGRLEQGTGTRWMNFSVRGGSYRSVRAHALPLFERGAPIEVCVVAMHPLILGRTRVQPLDNDIRRRLDATLDMLARTFQGRGYYAEVDPALDFEPESVKGSGSSFTRVRQLAGWEQRGIMDPEAFSIDSPEYLAAAVLLRDLEKLSKRLIIVKMPEEAFMQERIPQTSEVMFQELTKGYAVLDLQDALDKEMFADGVHANEVGRERVTVALLEYLKAPGLEATSQKTEKSASL